MEALIQLLYFVILLGLLSIPVAYVYKHRARVKRWIKDEHYGSDWYPSKITRAERRLTKANWQVEDATAQLAWEKEKQNKETEPGEAETGE